LFLCRPLFRSEISTSPVTLSDWNPEACQEFPFLIPLSGQRTKAMAREPGHTSQSPKSDNQGEGNWTAARDYDQDAKAFAESGKVEKAAQDAKRALDTKDAKALKEAERIGESHSHGEDPALKR
jgi:hypothetical protein